MTSTRDELTRGLNKVKAELKICKKMNKSGNADPFITVVEPFVTKLEVSVKKLEEHWSKSLRMLEDTVKFFGEKFIEEKPLGVFVTISHFVESFHFVHAENAKSVTINAKRWVRQEFNFELQISF